MDAIDQLIALTESGDEYQRAQGAIALADYRQRKILVPLMTLALNDTEKHVRNDALLALAKSRLGEAYFFCAGFYQKAQELFPEDAREHKHRILLGFKRSRDPRAGELFEQSATEYPELAKSARYPIITPFEYTFLGTDEMHQRALTKRGCHVTSPRDLAEIEDAFKDDHLTDKPQTYVVTTDGKFLLGGNLHEHVYVASGQPVIAAGQAFMSQDKQGWFIREIDNLSNGYRPHANCISHVVEALADTNVRWPGQFENKYPQNGWLDDTLIDVFWKELTDKIAKK